jgi:hypothetical protein
MCYFCVGAFEDYGRYCASAARLRSEIRDEDSFLISACRADDIRFSEGSEWSQPRIGNQVAESIFRNPSPDQGLLLFLLCCWLDLQADYTRVWNEMLIQTQRWLDTTAWAAALNGIPRGNFQQTKPHLLKTIRAISSQSYRRSVSNWFVRTVTAIARENSTGRGNIYRFAASICRDLYEAKSASFIASMAAGSPPVNRPGTHYKRLWMLIMFLRRDKSVIQCLLRRAVKSAPGGGDALALWYDDRVFDSNECELPVDSRVKEAWEQLPFVSRACASPEMVAEEARQLATGARASPSSFDAILFFR